MLEILIVEPAIRVEVEAVGVLDRIAPGQVAEQAHDVEDVQQVAAAIEVAEMIVGDKRHQGIRLAFDRVDEFLLGLAGLLVSKRLTFTSLAYPPRRPRAGECLFAENVKLNDVFYRGEPHMMQRYMALALDNIKRDPMAFAAASAYRMFRLFIIRGTGDRSTAQQFRWSQVAYGAGTVLSAAYFLVFLTGVVIAWRQRSALVLFVVPIVYVPLTICFVLTNMRYTVTVQPLMFVFVAVAVLAGLRLDEKRV